MDRDKAITLHDEEMYAAALHIQQNTTEMEASLAAVQQALDYAIEMNKGKSIDALQKLADTLRQMQGTMAFVGAQQRTLVNRFIRDVDYYDEELYDQINRYCGGME